MRKIVFAGTLLGVSLLAAPAIAADLRPMAAKAPPMAAFVPYSWTGFYFGFNAGYGFSDDNEIETRGIDGVNITNVALGLRPRTVTSEQEGFIGGVQLGYNWQFNNIVFGLETDIQYTDFRDRFDVFTGVAGVLRNEFRQDLDFLGTFRGRLGLAFDRALLYVTGGLAYGGADNEVIFRNAAGATVFAGTNDDIRVGYAVGGGFEYAFTNNISFKAEYLYYDLGDEDVTVGVQAPFTAGAVGAGYISNFEHRGHIIRGGINFKFGAPAAPVMARY
jgi:outer membrane immunogenic protein